MIVIFQDRKQLRKKFINLGRVLLTEFMAIILSYHEPFFFSSSSDDLDRKIS